MDIETLEKCLPLPAIMERLGLAEHARKSALCPFHEDGSASFSVYRNDKGQWRFKCHAGCGTGTALGFLMKLEGVPEKVAFMRWSELAGNLDSPTDCQQRPKVMATKFSVPGLEKRGLRLPENLHSGSWREVEMVAYLRNLNPFAVLEMQRVGVLRFGTVCGLDCWIVTDASGLVAEARRLDGRLFDGATPRKSHTLPGSVKSFPVGLELENGANRAFDKFLLTEGLPDLVAAYHFALLYGRGWLPISILGASIRSIHPKAIEILKCKQVRCVPHVDTSGRKAGEYWEGLLKSYGCKADHFDLTGLRKSDGSLVGDLNDCTTIHPDDSNEMEGLFA